MTDIETTTRTHREDVDTVAPCVEIVEDDDGTLAAAAARFEAWGEDDTDIDPARVTRPDNPLTRLEDAAAAAREADAQVLEAVQAAHAAGASWAAIGMVLGVSRQAVRQRFSPQR